MVPDRGSSEDLRADPDPVQAQRDEKPGTDPDGRAEAIAHSDRLALIDRGRVVGLFDSNDPSALETLVAQAKRRATPAWIRTLPAVNASLNALCACS